jgi:thiol-disulfide isomerase/thioredoxin
MAPTDETRPVASQHEEEVAPAAAPSARSKALIVLVVGLVFIALIGIRMADGMRGAEPVVPGTAGGPPTSEVADPAAAYEAALMAGRPIYVLFHSSTCAPCVEIAATAAKVLPAYEGVVTFVDVYTDDPRAQALYSRFAFQYIPTSFFLAPDGSVADQHTGVLDEQELRDRLDDLASSTTDS